MSEEAEEERFNAALNASLIKSRLGYNPFAPATYVATETGTFVQQIPKAVTIPAGTPAGMGMGVGVTNPTVADMVKPMPAQANDGWLKAGLLGGVAGWVGRGVYEVVKKSVKARKKQSKRKARR